MTDTTISLPAWADELAAKEADQSREELQRRCTHRDLDYRTHSCFGCGMSIWAIEREDYERRVRRAP